MRLIENPLRLLLWAIALEIFTCPEVELRAIAKRQSEEFDGLNYLSEFGYLAKANLETGALRSKQELENAIRQFQRIAALPQTGQLDSKTILQMKKPRCGMPDMNSSSTSGPQQFALGPSKWDKNDLTYRIDGYSSDLYWGDSREALANALGVWTEYSPLTFRETTGEADIVISFNAGYHNDGYAFDGPGNVLAHAFPPGQGRGGDAHFDEDERWTVRSQDGTNLYTVAAHEFGHSLGIYHSNIQGALMYPWYQGYNPKQQLLQTDDIEAIQRLYGGRSRPRPDPPRTTTRRPNVPIQTQTPPRVIPYTTRPRPRTAPRPDAPNPCTTDVDAVANIRGEIFGFKGQWFWRLTKEGLRNDVPSKIKSFWLGLPDDVESVDAVYERHDHVIVFFKGNRYWEFKDNRVAPHFPKEGKSLRSLGLPESVTEIQGAFTWGLNRRTYLFSGYNYWRMDPSGFRVEKGYPKATDNWTGVPVPFDTVFTHFDRKTYFFKGTEFWEFGDSTMRTEPGYPKKVVEMWIECPAYLKAFATKLTSSSTWTMFFLTLSVVLLTGSQF